MGQPRKPGPLHFTLIAVTCFCGVTTVTTVILHRDYRELKLRYQSEIEQRRQLERALRDQDDQLQRVRRLAGYDYERIGPGDPPDPSSVLGALLLDLRRYAGDDLPQETVASAFVSLAVQRDGARSESAASTASLTELERGYVRLSDQHAARLDAEHKARLQAEERIQTLIAGQEELVRSKEVQIGELRDEVQAATVELAQLQEALDGRAQAYRQKEANFRATIRKLRDEIDNRKSFDVADGSIRWIDRTTQTAWLDIGKSDHVRPGLTFSVFPASAAGAPVGGRAKGALRVTRVTGPHRAQAMIVDEKLREPFTPGDAVYSPLWSPGRTEAFALSGLADLDDDGRNDVAEIKRLARAAGARLIAYVDERGQRVGEPIDHDTSWLIVARLPEGDAEADRAILEQASAMRREADEYGVPVLNLNEFLSYVGYRPQRRLLRGAAAAAPAKTQPQQAPVARTRRLFRSGAAVSP